MEEVTQIFKTIMKEKMYTIKRWKSLPEMYPHLICGVKETKIFFFCNILITIQLNERFIPTNFIDK